MGTTPDFRLTISLGTIDGLGRKLYSNSSAVLAELIANAWDADATKVTIAFDGDSPVSRVIIEDDGCGMSVDDLNERYLTVGYAKREVEGSTSPTFKRPFMGRKGIGKLSVFAIAQTLTVMSRPEGGAASGFTIKWDELDAHCRESPTTPFAPTALSEDELATCPKHGTRIILSDLRKRIDKRVEGPLRTRIARRFDVFNNTEDNPFTVIINEQPISYDDRKDIRRCEYVWLLGGYDLPESAAPNSTILSIDKTDVVGEDGVSYGKIRGWIGTVPTPSQLRINDDDESLRNIIVLARSRPIQEGILDQIDFHQIFANYATGQVIADFLDDDEKDDIATSDRQRLVEDDPRVRAFKERLTDVFKDASKDWSERRRKRRVKILRDTVPVVGNWLDSITDQRDREIAEKLIRGVAQLESIEDADRNNLYQGAIMSFERLANKKALHHLEQMDDEEISAEQILALLTKHGTYEAVVYGRIIHDRITVITGLEKLVLEKALENRTRDFVAGHPWLLDPMWERATRSIAREQSFRTTAKQMGTDLDGPDERKRTDLVFFDAQDKILIVEFKRPGDAVRFDDATKQLRQYGKIMTRVLENSAMSEERPIPSKSSEGIADCIELALVASTVTDGGEVMNPAQFNGRTAYMKARFYPFDVLLQGARDRYQTYIEEMGQDSISDVLAALENTTPEDDD